MGKVVPDIMYYEPYRVPVDSDWSRYEHSCHLGEKIGETSVVIIKNYPLHHIGGVADSSALKELKQSKVCNSSMLQNILG